MSNLHKHIAVLILGSLFPVFMSATDIPANDPSIVFTGRTAITEDGSVTYNWTGIYFELAFEGSECHMRASDTGKNYFNLFVDGEFDRIVTIEGKDTTITLFDGENGKHLIRLQKRTEGWLGITTIHSFQLGEDGRLLEVTDRPTRHIEFIGDSYTCGYGTESYSGDDPWTPETEDCNDAYGCILARYFNADYTLIAHSGKGLIRNYGETSYPSPYNMSDLFGDTFDDENNIEWDFKASPYKPDAVVINLGTNDFWQPFPDINDFGAAYMALIDQVINAYGQDIPIICIMYSPTVNYYHWVKDYLPNVNIAIILEGKYLDLCRDYGASMHPNMYGQQKMAMLIAPYLSSATGWELPVMH